MVLGALRWPSAEPPNLNATDDALVLKDVLQQLTDRGADVVVVSHSYGGVVAGNALEGFGAKQRAAAGKKGGVIMNAYITSFAVPKGASLVDLLPNHEYLPWMRREVSYIQQQKHKYMEMGVELNANNEFPGQLCLPRHTRGDLLR